MNTDSCDMIRQPERAKDADERRGHGFVLVNAAAGNLPEPAAVEIPRRFLGGRLQQQESDAFGTPLKCPDIEDVAG